MESTTIEAVEARRIDELPPAFDSTVRLVRAGRGIRGFGVQIFDLPPNQKGMDDHDGSATGQVRRSIASGAEWLRLLGVGGIPGAAYEPPAVTEVV